MKKELKELKSRVQALELFYSIVNSSEKDEKKNKSDFIEVFENMSSS